MKEIADAKASANAEKEKKLKARLEVEFRISNVVVVRRVVVLLVFGFASKFTPFFFQKTKAAIKEVEKAEKSAIVCIAVIVALLCVQLFANCAIRQQAPNDLFRSDPAAGARFDFEMFFVLRC